MLTPHATSRAYQLRRSYIGISQYVHGLRPLPFHQPQRTCFARQTACLSTAAPSVDSSTLGPRQKRERYNISSDIPSQEWPKLDKAALRARQAVDQSTTSWDHLPFLKRAMHSEQLSGGKSHRKVRLYGYLGATRRAGKGLYFRNFIDPYLRTCIQLRVEFPSEMKLATEPLIPKPEDTSNTATNSEQAAATPAQNLADSQPAMETKQPAEGEKALPEQVSEQSSEIDHFASQSDSLEDTPTSDDQGEQPVETAEPSVEVEWTEGVEGGKEDQLAKVGVKSLASHIPVCIEGTLLPRDSSHHHHMTDSSVGSVANHNTLEIKPTKLTTLNSFPRYLHARHNQQYSARDRQLEFRTNHKLRIRIRQRSRSMALARKVLFLQNFDEIETPLLFKSTPEGAREFLVPTRKSGFAYALPQSPQQYKQLLIASGFPRYFQFAKCFRDEDHRTDRQPEFTQLDMEMAFAGREDVMKVIETILLDSLFPVFFDDEYPRRDLSKPDGVTTEVRLPQMTYAEAMRAYGSDKPDLRISAKIVELAGLVPDHLQKMLTSLESPIIEMFKVSMNGRSPNESRNFITSFMESPAAEEFINNPDGMPGITVFDSSRPLNGLASFGHDSAERLVQDFAPENGDILIAQARPDKPFHGGSTPLGKMRVAVHQEAATQDLLELLPGHHALWVTQFPLFTPSDEAPGGLTSTHHPFTAPLDDPSALLDPLSAIGDHFDLVINGVEIGGGSRRIHRAPIQAYVLQNILKLPKGQLDSFKHLLVALHNGCPPHAGFAIGFDRLMALLTNASTIRDVIAFPKVADGVDQVVDAPGRVDPKQFSEYHLKFDNEQNLPITKVLVK